MAKKRFIQSQIMTQARGWKGLVKEDKATKVDLKDSFRA